MQVKLLFVSALPLIRRRIGLNAVILALFLVLIPEVWAQNQKTADLLSYYMQARTRQIATDIAREGALTMEYRELEPLKTKAGVIQQQLNELNWKRLLASLPEPLVTFGITSMRPISKVESVTVESLFKEAEWSFVGSSSRSMVDTMKTADLRSRLEFHYGAPTRTLSEFGYPDSLRREDIVQFEYWFLVNGTIPVILMDVNGPWDRGIVLAAETKYRQKLELIKSTLLGQLATSSSRKSFIDYYYNFDQGSWYLTGFDGIGFFDKRIKRPNLSLGRPSPSLISNEQQ